MWIVNRPHFKTALAAIMPPITKLTTTLPILQSVMLQFGGGLCTLRSTNLAVAVRAVIPATGDEDAALCVPAEFLFNYLKLWPDTEADPGAELQIRIDPAHNKLFLSAGRHTGEMHGQRPEEYPADADPGAETPAFTIAAPILARLLDIATVAVATERHQNPSLQHVRLEIADEYRVYAVGCDGFRLHIAQAPYRGAALAAGLSWLIHRSQLADLTAVLKSWGEIDVQLSYFYQGKGELGRLRIVGITGEIVLMINDSTYFNWHEYLDTRLAMPDLAIHCYGPDLVSSLKTMLTIAKHTGSTDDSKGLVILQPGHGVLRMRAGVTVEATARSIVDAHTPGVELAEIWINGAFLRDAVAACGDSRVSLLVDENGKPTTPVMILPLDGTGFRALIQPQRAIAPQKDQPADA